MDEDILLERVRLALIEPESPELLSDEQEWLSLTERILKENEHGS